MVNVTALQNKLAVKVFSGLGSTVAVENTSSSTLSKWGDASITYGSSANVVAVPYLHIEGRQDYNPFGDLEAGELDMVFKHDQTIGINDRVTFNSTAYLVKEVEKFPLKDAFLAQVVRLRKSL